MIPMIAILTAVAVGLLGTALMSLMLDRDNTVLLQRLEELDATAPVRSAPAHDRRQAVHTRLRALLAAVAARRPGQTQDAGALRRMLEEAGFRGHDAPGMFFAARLLLAGTLSLIIVLLFPLLGVPAIGALFAVPYAVAAGWFAPRFWLARRAARRKHELLRALPDALDLLVVCVEAGLGLNQAIVRVSREIEHVSQAMAAELRLVNLEIQAGASRSDALRALGSRTGVEDLQQLAAMLIQADRFGTSIAQALRVFSDTLRTKRRQRAEEAAAKTTIKMVLPLVLFIFPALFVIILGPALLQVIRTLGGM